MVNFYFSPGKSRFCHTHVYARELIKRIGEILQNFYVRANRLDCHASPSVSEKARGFDSHPQGGTRSPALFVDERPPLVVPVPVAAVTQAHEIDVPRFVKLRERQVRPLPDRIDVVDI